MSQGALTIETDRYLDASEKLQVNDLDWNKAREVGTNDEEIFLLTYFSDIEAQTIVYLRDLLSTRSALDPDVAGFLSIWNYEEFFHGRALHRYLKECGHAVDRQRISNVRRSARFTEGMESLGAAVLSRIFSKEFPAVHTTWGAVQELTTLRAYEELYRMTPNPILKTLCERIAKQERRHFAWYFNYARNRLENSPRTQKLVRWILSRFWSPVGAGVKTVEEVARLFHTLFKGDRTLEISTGIDMKIGTLPGMEGISLMRSFVEKKVIT